MANDNEHNKNVFPQENEVIWVNKRYVPIELRSTAPVSRFKFLNPSSLPGIPSEWKKPVEPPLQFYSRNEEERNFYPFSPSTRCEEWSTLRQMLPSNGTVVKKCPPPWGTNQADPIKFVKKKTIRFPIINSPMTSYVDAMHVTNRLFKLH